MYHNSYFGFDPPSPRGLGVSLRVIPDSDFAIKRSYGSEAYFCTEPHYDCFKSSAGMVVYKRKGKHIFAIGGLLADDRKMLLQNFLEWIEQNHYRMTFFNVHPEDVELFKERGCLANKWGEEAIIDLNGHSWAGKGFEWLRRQRNYCARLGVSTCEEKPTEALLSQMEEICEESLADKPQRKEWGMLQSGIDPIHWGKRKLFVARKDGGLIGFLVALPYLDGKGWFFDIFRHKRDTIKGVVPTIMMFAIDTLQQTHAKEVSLGMVPGRGCKDTVQVSNKVFRFFVGKAIHKIPFVFDVAGIDHFKSRFRPSFEDRWVCSYPSVSLKGTIAVIHEIGFLNLHPWKTLRVIRRRRKKH